MNILALDENTNEILLPERPPVENEWAGWFDSEGVLRKRAEYHATIEVEAAAPIQITVAVTSAKIDGVEQADDYRLKLAKDSVTVLTFELRNPEGVLLLITDAFAVPLGQLGGAVIDSLALNFVDGVASLTETWNVSGEYVITEELLNTYVDERYFKYAFAGLAFSVYREGA